MPEPDKRALHQALVARLLDGPGRSAPAERRAAFDNAVAAEPPRSLIGKVAKEPTRVADADLAGAKASGLSEDEVFELVVCAAVGEATRQYDAALAALAALPAS